MPQTLTCDLAGAYHRPPAKIIIDNLPGKTPLILQPEPSNPYDAKAIRVLVGLTDLASYKVGLNIEAALENAGFDFDDYTHQPFHLGYIADSDGTICRKSGRPGNREIGQILYRADVGEIEAEAIEAVLIFSPDGKPLVQVKAP